MKKKQISREQIYAEVKHLDPKLQKNEEEYTIATILLSGLVVGANVEKIATFLKLPVKTVKKYEKNLRDNKVWVEDKTVAEWFKTNGGIAFWCDVAIAKGYLHRVKE